MGAPPGTRTPNPRIKSRPAGRSHAERSATFITVLVAWDLVGHLTLPLGVAGHECFTVIVGFDGLLLLRKKFWRPEES
jgi:hypothetical protein